MFTPEELKVITLVCSTFMFPIFFVAVILATNKLKEIRGPEKDIGFFKRGRGANLQEIKLISGGCPTKISIPLLSVSVLLFIDQILTNSTGRVSWSSGQAFTKLHVSTFTSTTFIFISLSIIVLISHINNYEQKST